MQIKLSEIISNQAFVNFGTIGSVSNGKSTIVRDLTGISTQKHSTEKGRNITINLGYANCKIFRCKSTGKLYHTTSSTQEMYSPDSNELMDLMTHISFVDCPGHENYMATMIGGTSVMDSCLLVIACNEQVPMPQTLDHLLTINQTDVRDLLIVQNKIDLLEREAIINNAKEIREFLDETPFAHNQMIPISAQLGWNVEEICKYIISVSPKRISKINEKARMTILRSFDINYPNQQIDDIKGAVIGGSLSQGHFKLGDIIEIRPGNINSQDGKLVSTPLLARIDSMNCEKNQLEYAFPGGLIGIGLSLDPSLTRKNALVGQIVGHIGTLPDLYQNITIKYSRMKNIKKDLPKIVQGEKIVVVINSASMEGIIESIEPHHIINVKLNMLVCTEMEVPVAIFRKIEHRYKLCYFGKIIDGDVYENIVNKPDYGLYFNHIENIEVIDDIGIKYNQPLESYDNLLATVQKPGKEPIKITAPELENMRGGKTLWLNYENVIKSVNRDKETDLESKIDQQKHILNFIYDNIGGLCSVNGDNHIIVRNKVNVIFVMNILKNYIKKFKTCPQCKSINTYLIKNEKNIQICCRQCTSVNSVV